MPVLTLEDGTHFELNRQITSIGSDPENDIVVTGDGVQSAHAHILKEGDGYVISPSDAKDKNAQVLINGKKRKRYRLAIGDKVQLGAVELTVAQAPQAKADDKLRTFGENPKAWKVEGYKRLQKFAERLAGRHDVDSVVAEMLDDVIAVLGADKGFLIMLERGRAAVKVARGVDGPADAERLSDSIVERVLERREPIIVSDAINDTVWGTSKSVAELKLSSVMCAPLMYQEDLLGAIYVGNDQVANLFTEPDMEVLQVFAGHAALALQNALLMADLKSDAQALRQEIDDMAFGDIIGAADSMRRVGRGRDRNRQGAHRQRGAPQGRPGQGTVHPGELRCHSGEPAGERALRPHPGRVYRRRV
jgi:GAF domain-containing protein